MGKINYEKYNQFAGQENIIYGIAELPFSVKHNAWAIPNGFFISNRQDAIRYAKKMHYYMSNSKIHYSKRWYLRNK